MDVGRMMGTRLKANAPSMTALASCPITYGSSPNVSKQRLHCGCECRSSTGPNIHWIPAAFVS